MTVTFRRALREKVPLLIGLAGGTGSGKTFSAMRIAKGIVAETGKRFAVLDTEAGRARHYADQFEFDHGDLAPPFTPERYADAIGAADKAGYPVVVVDSVSHVWAGDGGCLDMQEAEFERMGSREAGRMASWIKPKIQHKRMVAKLLQLRAHVILCFRAEPKVEMTRDDKGKMQVVAKTGLTGIEGWFPICEKMLPYELTISLLLLAQKPGVPLPIKLQQQHRSIVSLSEPLAESVGAGLAGWAAGGAPPVSGVTASPANTATVAKIETKEADSLRDAIISADVIQAFREHFKVLQTADLTPEQTILAWEWLNELRKT